MKIYSVALKGLLLTAVGVLGAGLVGVVQAQITLTGAGYQQDFNQLGTQLPPGWSVRTNATASSLGVEAPLVTNATAWSSSSGQFANFASTTNDLGVALSGTETSLIQSAVTNRCLGLRQTSGFGDPGAAFVLHLKDTLGLSGFKLTVDLNMLSVQGRSTPWTIDYGIGTAPDAFVPLGSHADTGVFGTTLKTVDFGTAIDHQAEPVWIRIVSLAGSVGTGSRDTFGIDNVHLTFQSGNTPTPTPPPLSISIMDGNAMLVWTNAGFILESADTPTGVFAPVDDATSPHTCPLTGDGKFFRLRAGENLTRGSSK